ncbi:MAG: family 43 glycosylhydrolase [Lachnospiraceae bacterium]|jgi:GH43 family beta-xylosidase|nr:family 43 glycosylhydrolase [Lachnospiraceae bacterium]
MKIKNPIAIHNIGDPYVLFYKGMYYLYATSHFNGFYCWKSKDLNQWEPPEICYEAGKKSFGNSCFWAPEVYEFGGMFYMYYTAQWKIYEKEALRIGVAVSDSPQGPFEDVLDNQPMFDFGYGALDAHILKDGKRNYLYYSRAGADHIMDGARQSEIYVAELGTDKCSVIGEGKLILKPEQEWERQEPEKHQFWNEGPFVVKHNGKYHMMYSANCFASRYYAIGGAMAVHPMGPFVKYKNNPILSASQTISGPGHNCVVQGPDGACYCIYHAHTDYRKPGSDRQVYIGKMWFKEDEICVQHPLYSSIT